MSKVNPTYFIVFFVLLLTVLIEFSGALNLPTFDLKYRNFSNGQLFEKKINLDKPINLRKNVAENLSINFKPNGYATIVNITVFVSGPAPFYKYNNQITKSNCLQTKDINKNTLTGNRLNAYEKIINT